MNILMVAAENDALPGGKVGGIGDVVRDVPPALASLGHKVNVITPGYGVFSKQPGALLASSLAIEFAGRQETVELYKVCAKVAHKGVILWALEHPLFRSDEPGAIYCDDPSDRPFATDATKFALFCKAVCQAVKGSQFGSLDVLHLHDWHASLVAVLRAFDAQFSALKKIRTAFTIHNLALQGVRPLSGDDSSLESWFPSLIYDRQQINDPRVSHCVNLMRAGIRLSDRVHAVSPTYAKEIQSPSNPEQGFFGGEGLQLDLQQVEKKGRLHGILNGCDYSSAVEKSLSLNKLLMLCESELMKWIARKSTVDSAHLIALHRLTQMLAKRKTRETSFILTSVGRITEQKLLILQQRLEDGRSALEHLLDALGNKGYLILLGSGNIELENYLASVAASKTNFLFLKGYSEPLSNAMYSSGGLFLMPSSFEPCGISQMLAMRAAQPCLVHGVGGLCDTVVDNETGFIFNGESISDQAENMLVSLKNILKLYKANDDRWMEISSKAAKARFLWGDAVKEYVDSLYSA